MSSVEKLLLEAIARKDEAEAIRLIEGGVSVDTRNADGYPVLLLAVRKSLRDVVRVLLGRGAPVDVEGPWHETALHEAAVQGDRVVGELLLDAGADIERRDTRTQATPLLEAARFGNRSFVKLLLARGARRDVVDATGYSALSLAQLNDHTRVEEVLLAEGLKPQPEHEQTIAEVREHVRAHTAPKP